MGPELFATRSPGIGGREKYGDTHPLYPREFRKNPHKIKHRL